jgi:hypothetical protein
MRDYVTLRGSTDGAASAGGRSCRLRSSNGPLPAAPAAYALTRLPVPGKRLILLVIVAGSTFPQIATMSPQYLLMRALGLRDT